MIYASKVKKEMLDWIKSKLSELKNAVKEAREIDRNASKFWKLAEKLKRAQQIDKAIEPEWVHQAKYYKAGGLLCQCFRHDFLPDTIYVNKRDELYFRWAGKENRFLFLFFEDMRKTSLELHWTETDSNGETQHKDEYVEHGKFVARFNDVQISNLKEFLGHE